MDDGDVEYYRVGVGVGGCAANCSFHATIERYNVSSLVSTLCL